MEIRNEPDPNEWDNGTTIVIRNVPAGVCQTCGEDYLDVAVASSVETVLQEAAPSGVRLELREYKVA